jgi:TonB dependent receptor-like, beta-barrel/CarboxypepD_reg-like domain/TonB-dependent Receptor Plug Domain
MHKYYYTIIILIFAFTNFILAGTTGKIAGRVTDKTTGEPLPFVNIVIVGTTMGAASDVDGYYNILNLAPGTYSVKASAIGYNSMLVENVKVSIDFTTKVDFTLAATSVELGQEVVVIATKPLVQKDLTSSTATINSQDIQALPITSFQDALQLQAGIVKDQSGNFHFRGGRSGEVSYWIDGVPVTNAYDGGTVVDVNKNSIQEMQLVTGAFNAEYGQAMSGIVNIATKSGSNETHGNITAYSGAYLTQNSDVFYGTKKVDPFSSSTQNKIDWLEGSLNGPIIKDLLFYYVDARYYYTGGYLFGQRKYNTYDIANTVDVNPANWNIQQTGDGSIVSMAPLMEGYAQGKLTLKLTPAFTISYDYILDNTRGKDYDFTYKYNPDGLLSNFKKGYLNSLTITHAVSSSTFYTLGISNYFNDFREYLDQNSFSLSDLYKSEDPFDQKYVNTKLLQPPEATFNTGGTNMTHNVRNTNTYVAKIDLTSQISNNHEIKTGVLFNYYTLYLHNINLHMSQADNNRDPVTDGKPFLQAPVVIPSIESQDNLFYQHNPWQFSYYAQDKMEYQSLIVNFGLRFDYFHPDGQILADPSDPNIYLPLKPQNQDSVVAPGGTHTEAVAKRMTYWYKNATDKWQVSPRLGVSFPITDRGVIHFSYGLFFQIPSFQRLYENPGYKLAVTGGSTSLGIIGNPDLKPEQTTSGELGLQQQLTDDIAIDITGYFRDIRNLAGTLNEIQYVFGGSKVYSQYVNTDFGFIRGIVLSVNKRFTEGISATLDYTFQIAKGNASDPASAFNLRNSGVQAETQLIPLDWDQTHTVNATFNYVDRTADWGGSVVLRFSTGQPYTPQNITNVGTLVYNSQNKPSNTDIDVNLYKDFTVGPSTLSVFLRINNLLDTKNATQVYTDTGQPDWSLEEQQQLRINAPHQVSSIQDWYTRPNYYSEPRRVELGTTISF